MKKPDFLSEIELCTYIIKQNIDSIEKEAYQKGIDTYDNYINEFWKSNPKTRITFEKWKENNN